MSKYGLLMTPMGDAKDERPSQSHSTRFGWDQQIRQRGYAIKRRPVFRGIAGEPVWEQNGVEYTHSEVLDVEGLG